MDVIITGRGVDELQIVGGFLDDHGWPHSKWPEIFLNPITRSMGRTREDSGRHKASTLRKLITAGRRFNYMFEDDPVQFLIIEDELLNLLNEGIDHGMRMVHVNSYWTEK